MFHVTGTPTFVYVDESKFLPQAQNSRVRERTAGEADEQICFLLIILNDFLIKKKIHTKSMGFKQSDADECTFLYKKNKY